MLISWTVTLSILIFGLRYKILLEKSLIFQKLKIAKILILILTLTETSIMPNFYSFSGDGVTWLGAVGIVSSLIILFTAFRRYANSPLKK